MKNLKKQINRLIDVAEEDKLRAMIKGDTCECDYQKGIIDGLKIIRVLLSTNLIHCTK